MEFTLLSFHHVKTVSFWFLIGLCGYSFIPTVIVRGIGGKSFYKRNRSTGIALTFDDGPDPTYTPQLLDLLRKYRIQAAFFVLGSKAEQHPELIKRMQDEGHLIGIHNYRHWSNALLTPKRVRKQLQDTENVIVGITGSKPMYYRPPWGVINVFDFLLARKYQFVLWTLMVKDWRCSGGKERIKRKLLARLKHNDIIVLHDSGQTLGADRFAPRYMLEALEEFLAECKRKELVFLRVDDKIRLEAKQAEYVQHSSQNIEV
ncbi:polysaccharide deacetylase family protein [Paenibacillus ferrarius]|uniref:polysaccharide deacetylase family protein n=1 Tax=Paenibacillus ferrarius TaxID=1469647 RepID=UPI003D2B5648